MRSLSTFAIALAGLVAVGACTEESPAEREAKRQAARADSVALADSLFDPAVFDTLTWASPEARLERGGMVWRASCAKCHGSDGQGAGDFARQFDIEVPSFLSGDWPYAGDVAGIRHRIFTGHENVMPIWGLYGLKYRDVDAATAFIDKRTSPLQTPRK